MEEKIVSKVWLIKGLIGKVQAGVLVWKDRQVAFITEEGIQFNVPLTAIRDIKWPFLRMGLGFDAVVDGKKFKFSFSKPNPNAPEINVINRNPFPEVVFAGQYFDDISSLKNLKTDRATTKIWKVLLAEK